MNENGSRFLFSETPPGAAAGCAFRRRKSPTINVLLELRFPSGRRSPASVCARVHL